MKVTTTLLVLLSTLIACHAGLPTRDDFENWMTEHGKVYSTEEEYASRFQKYLDTHERIIKLNAESPDAVFAHNKFSDLSPREFKAIYLTANVPKEHLNAEVLDTKPMAIPSSFDWRKHDLVTPVKDQGQCGSCWAFSATENVESVWMKARNITAKNMAPLSPQQIVDCDKEDGGCQGGDTVTAFQYIIKAGGLTTNKMYPYTGEDGTCVYKPSEEYAKIYSWKYTTDPNKPDEHVMAEHLVATAPTSICVDAAKGWQNYQSGVLKHSQCGHDLDHCVQAVGYDMQANPPYWIVRNSWGVTWGEQGYIRLEYGYNTCGVADEATTAIEK